MLRDQITETMKNAMRAKDTIPLATLRLILAAMKDRDIAARSKGNTVGITDDEILSMMQSMIKQRRDSIEMYEKGGRPELAEREALEITVIESFLPTQMGEGEVKAAVDAIMTELEATSMKDMGRVMAALKERFAGSMDFGKASGVVKAKICGN
ncbi:MAG: glutamyl-tRNA amidotransferase [Rhodospirillaceae bacterium]|nr:MAG: glutamyl-tRNA amidotransferase [Rhodospirillaceae bacterium]